MKFSLAMFFWSSIHYIKGSVYYTHSVIHIIAYPFFELKF